MKETESNTAKIIKNTWILLFLVWFIFLIPIPGTSYLAFILNLGALVMTIVVIAKGRTQQGILQLLSIFIITPIFYFAGIIIFLAFLNKSVDLNTISSKALSDIQINNYNNRNGTYKNYPHNSYKNIKKNEVDLKINKEKNKVQEYNNIHTVYKIYLKNGGNIECTDIFRKENSLNIKNTSGLLMDIDLFQVEKIEKFVTINNKTTISSWKQNNN